MHYKAARPIFGKNADGTLSETLACLFSECFENKLPVNALRGWRLGWGLQPPNCTHLPTSFTLDFLPSLCWRLRLRGFGGLRRLQLGQRFIHALLEVTLVVVRKPAIH